MFTETNVLGTAKFKDYGYDRKEHLQKVGSIQKTSLIRELALSKVSFIPAGGR